MPVTRTGKELCYRCHKTISEGHIFDSLSHTPCDKCIQIIERENKQREEKRKREERENEREEARQAELAKKRAREQKKDQEKILASGGRLCPICGTALSPRLPEIELDKKTGKSTFKESWPSACLSCRAHGQEVLRRMR